jgi:hypothetical protein
MQSHWAETSLLVSSGYGFSYVHCEVLLHSRGCFYISKVIDYTSPDNLPLKFTSAELRIFRLFLHRQYNPIININNFRLGTAFRLTAYK